MRFYTVPVSVIVTVTFYKLLISQNIMVEIKNGFMHWNQHKILSNDRYKDFWSLQFEVKRFNGFNDKLVIWSNQKTCLYNCEEWKIEQTSFLNFEKRLKNVDFLTFFVKTFNFMTKLSWKTSKKRFNLLQIVSIKNPYYSKFKIMLIPMRKTVFDFNHYK